MIERIASPSRTKEILTKYQFVFQKKYGQNFLIDLHVLNKIIDSADIQKDDLVIEIGPGIGSLTQELAERGREVIAIEIDKKLIPILEETLSAYNNVTVINEDVLQVDLKQLIMEKNNGKPVKVIANLPYYITTPIIMRFFEEEIPLDRMTVMVQKEVAERMEAKAGTKDYGALTLAVNYYAKPYIVAYVPHNCFMPRPNVGSAVIELKKYQEPLINVSNKEKMFQIIRAVFNQRRKTMLNSVSNLLGLDKALIKLTLTEMGLSETIRGENLTLEEFAKFTTLIEKKLQANK